MESKFLHMVTSFECQVVDYHKKNNSEFILLESQFSTLEKKIIPERNQN